MAAAKKEWRPGINLYPVAIGNADDPPGYTLTIRMVHEDLVSFYKMLKANGNVDAVSMIESVVPQIAEAKVEEQSKISLALKACERCEALRPIIPNDEKRVKVHFANGHENG